jgi:hypothetical protein
MHKPTPSGGSTMNSRRQIHLSGYVAFSHYWASPKVLSCRKRPRGTWSCSPGTNFYIKSQYLEPLRWQMPYDSLPHDSGQNADADSDLIPAVVESMRIIPWPEVTHPRCVDVLAICRIPSVEADRLGRDDPFSEQWYGCNWSSSSSAPQRGSPSSCAMSREPQHGCRSAACSLVGVRTIRERPTLTRAGVEALIRSSKHI